MSVASILQALAENAGRRDLQRGAILGGTITDVSQLPAQILQDRYRQKVQNQALATAAENQQFKRAEAARADAQATHQADLDRRAATAQDAADLKEQALKALISAGFEKDQTTFDLGAAVSKARELGAEDLIPTVAAVHDKLAPKVGEAAPGSMGRYTSGPHAGELVPDSQVPNNKPLEAKPITFGPLTTVAVDGKPSFVRTGSDGALYGLNGKTIDSSLVAPLPDKPAKDPTPHYQLQPEIDPKTNTQTGRFLGFNTLTNTWEPVKGEGPASTKAAPGASQLAVKAHDKQQALSTLDKLDQAIEDAKDLIGPGKGRIGTLEQLIGNADPNLNRLGVFIKSAKMQVDAGIGGARAAASPTLLKQWDNLLSNNIEPAGLKASVQAMREMLQGDSAAGPKPTHRYNPATGAVEAIQ